MKLTMKRLFSVLLVLCMMLSVLPVGAFADDEVVTAGLPGISATEHTFKHIDMRIAGASLTIVKKTVNVATGETIKTDTETIKASVTAVHSVTVQGTTYTGFTKSGTYEFRKTNNVSLKLSNFNSNSTAVAVLDLQDGNGTTWKNVTITFNANGIADAALNCDGYKQRHQLDGLDFDPSAGSASNIYSEYVHYVVPVRKDWSDSDNQDGLRPDGITVNLLKNGEVVSSAVLNAGNNWYHEFAVDGNASDANAYSVAEASAPDGYTKSDAVIKDGIFVITNTHETAKRNISVTKVWHDDGTIRPTSIEVKLLADGTVVEGKTATLTAENGWTYTWENLPVNAAGKAITYTIQEADVSGYQSAVTGDAANGFTVTNTQTTTVSGTKTWDDGDNRDNKRPDSITINLNVRNSDGVEVVQKSKTVTEKDNWKWSFTNLPKYDTNGNLITYTITENPVSGYTSHVDGYNVKNSYSPETTSVRVTKEWDDAQNQDGVRPASVVVVLTGSDGSSYEQTLNAENNWEYTWNNLPKNSKGNAITYTATEKMGEADAKNYKSEVTGNQATGYTITNTHTPATITISGEKTWDLSTNKTGEEVKLPESITVRLKGNRKEYEKTVTPNGDGRWFYSFENLPKYAGGKEIQYTITEDAIDGFTPTVDGFNLVNVYTPGETSVSVKKEWNDGENQDGLRPESVTVKLYAFGLKEMGTVVLNESNGWTHTFTGLNQKFMGVDIQYTVKEVDLSKDYKANVTGDMTKGYIITNTHTPATTSVSVEKVWDDEDDLAGFRPDSVEVQLYKTVGNSTVPFDDAVELKASTVQKDNWKYKWENLPVYEKGTEITYTVGESAVTNYTAAITGNMDDGFTITNTHTPERMNVTVHKTWDDGHNADGLRPDAVTVQLLRNGDKVGEATLNAENQWTYTFENQPVYAGGEEADYVVVEKAVANYQAKVVYKDTDTGLAAEITNTYTPEETSITVTKKWTDNDDKLGERPDKVTIYLLADGEKTGDELVLSKENKWTGTFEDLPLNKDGEEIKYTVSEKTVKNYKAKVTGSAEKGFVVTNTHTSIPTTGDESNLPLFAVLFSIGAVALVSAVVLGRKKYGKRG